MLTVPRRGQQDRFFDERGGTDRVLVRRGPSKRRDWVGAGPTAEWGRCWYLSDVAAWPADAIRCERVAESLRDQLRAHGDEIAWRREQRYHRHYHIDVHDMRSWVDIPQVVLSRSNGEDPFWRPEPTPAEVRERWAKMRLKARQAPRPGEAGERVPAHDPVHAPGAKRASEQSGGEPRERP